MCEYCEKKANNKKMQDVDNDIKDFIKVVFLPDAKLHVQLDAVDADGYVANDFFDINYCPMCRKEAGRVK